MTEKEDSSLSALMASAQGGNKCAYEEVLRRTSTFLKKYLRKKNCPGEALDDVAQEILLSIHKARPTFDPKRSYIGWVIAIAERRLCDYWRTQYREEASDRAHSDGEAALPLFSPSLSIAHASRFFINAGLSDTQQTIIHLLKFEGLSIKEVAVKLGITEGAVKVSAHRGYQALKKSLGDD